MAGFRRVPGGVSARFSLAQAKIIRDLVSQVAELIAGPGAMPAAGSGPGSSGPATSSPDSWTGGDPEGREAGAGEPFTLEELDAALGVDGPSQPPDDPVLARLFPDAYAGDVASAGEFRRYTEPELRSGKVEGARILLATLPSEGGKVRLSGPDAEIWLRVLNDVRLALGVRLGITEDYGHELSGSSDDSPWRAYLQVYDWLTFLQDSLVQALW